LALVQEFINAWDLWGEDRMSKPVTLHEWLLQHKLIGQTAEICESDVRHALEVREALRDLLAANDGRPVPKAASETLSRAARSAQLGVQFESQGQAHLEARASGVDAAIGTILAVAVRSMLDGSWSRLKICRDDTCRWAFYDRSKNRSSCWCLMSVCGNRAKARAYRQHRSGDHIHAKMGRPSVERAGG
jgi:predicted RNA-binding Zn ribbon-like protein